MSRLQPQSRSEEWRELRDDVRGARSFRFSNAGLPIEAWLASGEHAEFSHDASGSLRSIDVDGDRFLTIEPEEIKHAIASHVSKGTVTTHVRINDDGSERVLQCGRDTLRLEYDRQGRIERASLPGSPTPLQYRWDDESCTIGPAGGDPLIAIEPASGAIRFTLAESGGGWDETPALVGTQTITARNVDGGVLAVCRTSEDATHRATARRWNDGSADVWTRDSLGRLAAWTRERAGLPAERHEYGYNAAGDIASECVAQRTWIRRTDCGHRVTALVRPDQSVVEYRYDGAGRRVARIENGEETTYEYDILGQLTRVTTPRGGHVYSYDGLGRRVTVTSSHGTIREHRDSGGRLWSITDARGRALHTFIWFGGRVIARLPGDSDQSIAEAFITDAGGTLIAVLAPDGREIKLERIDPPPFGSIASPARPTLYGHFGDPETLLIHFGARELDPEVGVFLTPDPWDGAPDDPRLWEGGDAKLLARHGEIPAATVHPYGLCHFDPVGRTDLDGHYVDGWGIVRTLLLAPTWGAPLTAISLFFFLPFDIYFEIIAGFFLLFINLCTHSVRAPWANHHIWKLIGAAGSARQGLIAFGLNGLLPRWISGRGLHSDRAVTIGHVIWINRDELNRIDQPHVLDVWNIGGPPGPGGAATGGPTAFNSNPATESVVAVTGTENGVSRIHVARWTRGFANTVVDVAGDYKFEDRPIGGPPGIAPGEIHMLTPLPIDFPAATDPSSAVSMKVEEYTFVAGGKTADADLAASPFASALRIATSEHAAKNDFIEIGAPEANPALPPVFAKIVELSHDINPRLFIDDKIDTLFIDTALPPGFLAGGVSKKLTVKRIIDDTPAYLSAGWQLSGGVTKQLEHAAVPADWPPAVRKDDLYKITTGANVSFARVEKIEVTLELAPPVAPNPPDVGGAVTLLRTEDAQFNAEVPDVANATTLHMLAGHPSVSSGDLLLVKKGAAEAFVRVTNRNGDNLTVTPSLTSLPLEGAGPTGVTVQHYIDTNTSRDTAPAKAVNGDRITVEASRAGLYPVGGFAAYSSGGSRLFRRVGAVPLVKIFLTHDVAGAAPFTLTRSKIDSSLDVSGIEASEQMRFLQFVAGTHPSSFDTFPNSILAIYPQGRTESDALFYINPVNPAALDPKYRKKWSAQTVAGNDYWFLFEDLPFETENSVRVLRLDEGWTLATPGPHFKVMEYRKGTAACIDGTPAGARVLAKPGEVQVPVRPTVHDTHRRALLQHELHHAVQNSKWGPMMGALPLQGIFSAIDILNTASHADEPNFHQPEWLKQIVSEGEELENQGLGWAQVFSIGGIMQFAWKYFFLLPAYFSDDARKTIGATKFDFWGTLFSPIIGGILGALPPVMATDSPGDRWGNSLFRLFNSAFDLRSWTPFTGFVPTLLPDGPQSFLEQQASRASGDTYSTILMADDHFNLHTRPFFVPDTHDADRKKKLGEVTRFLMFAHYRSDRVLDVSHNDLPGSPLKYCRGAEPTDTTPDALMRIQPGPDFSAGHTPAAALFHPDLYESTGVAPTQVTIEGPAPARQQVQFWSAGTATEMQPRLRAVVPTPPRVIRSTGFYFIPATPGVYDVTAYYPFDVWKRHGFNVPDKQFANTEHAKITVGGAVKLGDRDVAWAEPVPVGAPPAAVAALPTLQMFLTETARLAVDGLTNAAFKADIEPAASTAFTLAVDGTAGWKIEGGTALPGDHFVRVRIYRLFDKNDPAFDLTFDAEDTPTLSGIRSYLASPIWIPVRDFRLELMDIRAILDAVKPPAQAHEVDIPIPVAGPANVTVTPAAGAPALPRLLVGPSGRGQKWRFGPPAAPVVAPAVYRINFRFGRAGHTVDRSFQLTYQP